MAEYSRHPSSFRDPSGYVFTNGQRVIRALSAKGVAEFTAARDSGVLDAACAAGLLVSSRIVTRDDLGTSLEGARGESPAALIEHPLIPSITYPYEWTFGQLRDAALQHLDLQLLALRYGFELSDATAYNMQFDAGMPIHIDVLSLRRYREGQPWEGYNQFSRQFLFPLLLESVVGIRFNSLYRGNINGIELEDIKRLTPIWRRWTNINVLMHVQLQSNAIRQASSSDASSTPLKLPNISAFRYRALLEGLRDWISNLQPSRSRSYWADYAKLNSYSNPERVVKHAVIHAAVRRLGTRTLLDIGGNSGDFSETALAAGVSRTYCIDTDASALDIAYSKRKAGRHGLLPLIVDWSNPSPGQGWRSEERLPVADRLQTDTVMALAVIHHFVIGGNIPLREFVRQLFAQGENVIVEFVPKTDPMVRGMLRGRKYVFDDYTEENFIAALEHYSTILETARLQENGRVVFICQRK